MSFFEILRTPIADDFHQRRPSVCMPKGKVRNKSGFLEVNNGYLAFNLSAAINSAKAFGKGFLEQGVIHGVVAVAGDQVGALVEREIAMLAVGGHNLGFRLPAGT